MPEPSAMPSEDNQGNIDAVASSLASRHDVPAASAETLQVLAEDLLVSKREVIAGTVRIATRTETYEEMAEISLAHTMVEVTRVPVGQIVEAAPEVRTEGDTMIVPVVEERFVIVKQLFLKEELHIKSRAETEISRAPVQLRRQTAIVERLDASGTTAVDGIPT